MAVNQPNDGVGWACRIHRRADLWKPGAMRAVRNTSDGIEIVDVPHPEPAGASEPAGGSAPPGFGRDGAEPGAESVRRAEPRPALNDPVLVDPVSVGICGSDLHVIAMGPRPNTLGHEIGARFEGRPVAIQPMAFCGACRSCLRGEAHLCTPGNQALHGIHLDGGMADHLLVDRSCLVELPEAIGPETASLVEPMAVGVHAVNKADLESGMRVAVVGAGTVGLIAGAVAATHGVQTDIVARHRSQAEAAEKLGLGLSPGRGYDVVFDGAGTDSSIAKAIELVRPGGTIVVPGIFWGDVTMPGLALGLKEVRLLAALYWGHHHGEREIDIAARLLAELPELPAALITHRFPLDDAPAAFAAATNRSAGAIKVVVDVR